VKCGFFSFVPPPDPALISDCALDRKSNTYNKSTFVIRLFIRQREPSYSSLRGHTGSTGIVPVLFRIVLTRMEYENCESTIVTEM
jgi:hypothetical protein